MPFSHQHIQLQDLVYMASSRAIPGHTILGHIRWKQQDYANWEWAIKEVLLNILIHIHYI